MRHHLCNAPPYFYLTHITPIYPGLYGTCSIDTQTFDNLCDIGVNSENQSPISYIQSLYHDTKWQCIYDRNLIDTIQQSENAIKKFGPDNSLTRAFCQSKTSTCPIDMTHGCSRYFSIAPDGAYCRNIFNNSSPAQRDEAITNYCMRNDTDDCKCVNRSEDENYARLKQGNPFSDACWYIPCANKDRYLVPSEFTENPTCPANICQIVFDISQAHNVDIDDVKNDISCDFGGGGYVPKQPSVWIYYVGLVLAVVLLIVYYNKNEMRENHCLIFLDANFTLRNVKFVLKFDRTVSFNIEKSFQFVNEI